MPVSLAKVAAALRMAAGEVASARVWFHVGSASAALLCFATSAATLSAACRCKAAAPLRHF